MKPAIWLAALTMGVLSTSAMAQTDPSMMPTASQEPMNNASNAPLTRAQVRADLARARADGTIPRFGNPDPYGPARWARGAPSMYPGR